MDNFEWCKKQERGISLIEKSSHLSDSYLKDAYESFDACLKIEGKWKVITGYYACYNAVYSILMKCGIKSEIHNCTIRLMEFFKFSKEEIKFLEKLKIERINAQYYLKKVRLPKVLEIKKFISKCEFILSELNDNQIEEIRGKLK